MLIHNYLFYELARRGSPEKVAGFRIKYDYLNNETDLEGFEDETELKIKIMGEIWQKLKENKTKIL